MSEEADVAGYAAAARALCEEGARLHDRAEYDVARARYERALALLEGTTDADPAEMARCLGGLGRVLMKLGDDSAAEGMLERALAIQNRALGSRHPDRAATLHDLGELRANLGDLRAGVALLRDAVGIRRRALGADHPDTLESTAVLALLLAHGGDRARAEWMLVRALALCERRLGERHRATARLLNALGRLWARDEATRRKARSLYERALVIYEALLGPSHPWVALVLSNLAALLADQQDYEAARPLVARSLAIHERVYGPVDWRTSYVLVNLADIHSSQGDCAAARPLLERALIIRERTWGAEHPETVAALRKLVAVLGLLHQEGDESAMREASALFPCLTALEAAGGKRDLFDQGLPGSHLDPAQAAARLHDLAGRLEAELARPPLTGADQAALDTASDLIRQADEWHEAGSYAVAVARLEDALRLQERVLGEYHLDHVDVLRKLADARQRAGQYSAVLPLYQRVVDIHLRVLGSAHPMTAAALSDLMQRIDYEYGSSAGLPLQEQVLASMEEALGAGDPIVAMARRTVERIRTRQGGPPAEGWPAGPSRSERREAALAALSLADRALLDGLEAVDWHSLRHAYGPADDVPDLLRLLLADAEDVRESAWYELYGNLWHQGDVYQATSYAVPFLLRMLQAANVPGKADILAFLQAIATGAPYLTERHTWMEATLAEDGRDFQAEIELARGYARRAHEAVAGGVELYLGLPGHPDPAVRESAFVLLLAFPERAGRVVPVLLACVESEPQPDVRARLIRHLGLSLAELLPTGGRDQVARMLEGLVRSEEPRQVRFAAAVALARVAADATPPIAIALLAEAAARPEGLYPGPDPEISEPGWAEGFAVEEACAAISHVDEGRRVPALMRLLNQVTVPARAHQVALLLLDSALLGLARTVEGTGTPESSAEAIGYGVDDDPVRVYPRAEAPLHVAALTPIQRQALQAVLDSVPVWALPSNLLEIYGLPASRDAARDLL